MRCKDRRLFIFVFVATSLVVVVYNFLANHNVNSKTLKNISDEENLDHISSYDDHVDQTVSGPEPVKSEVEFETSFAGINIDCVINGANRVPCVTDENRDEVYLPFKSFLAPYFDVTGGFAADDNSEFNWWHSIKVIKTPDKRYDPVGNFASFNDYNVESRKHVELISAAEDVPMSNQWGPEPYFYPIQICQFALQHYSQNLIEIAEPANVSLLSQFYEWEPPLTKRKNDREYYFDGASGDLELKLTPGQSLLTLSASLRWFSSTGYLAIALTDTHSEKRYVLRYLLNSQVPLSVDDSVSEHGEDLTISFGLGMRKFQNGSLASLTRNLHADLVHGLSKQASNLAASSIKGSKQRKKRKKPEKVKVHASSLKVTGMLLRGSGAIKTLALSSSSHMDHFLAAAGWLLRNQDAKGGWPIPVKRKLVEHLLELQPNWYSAMAQGHAMSVLTRAFHVTRDERYLAAALWAGDILDVMANLGGVKNLLFDFPWYEEYPTYPFGTYVLNGFMYTLVGLYDLQAMAPPSERQEKIKRLYKEGMNSLSRALPLFDAGHDSFYDLRHVSIPGLAPNRARWDYHNLHVYLLLLIDSFEPNEAFTRTAQRWIQYAQGKPAKHN